MIGVLGLALGAFAIDRFVLGSSLGPSAASASPANTEGPVESLATRAPASEKPNVAQRLVALSASVPADGARDGFSGSPAWLTPAVTTAPVKAAAEPVAPPSVEDSLITAARQIKVAGVFGRGDRAAVSVNGRIVRVGESISGLELVGVSSNAAVFSDGQQRCEVTTRGDVRLVPAE